MIGDDDPFSGPPYSRPPLSGSVSDRHWVKFNASLFSANAAWSAFKAVLFVVVALVTVAILSVLFGTPAVGVFLGVLVVALLVVGLRAQRRRRARVPRW